MGRFPGKVNFSLTGTNKIKENYIAAKLNLGWILAHLPFIGYVHLLYKVQDLF